MSGSHRCFCSSVPRVTRPKQLSACTETPTPTLAQTAADLLEDLQVDLVGLAAAAVLLGVGQPEHAGPAEQPEDVAREGLGGLGLGGAGVQLLGRRGRGPAGSGRWPRRWASRGWLAWSSSRRDRAEVSG